MRDNLIIKKLASLLLVVMMCVTMMPVGVFADDANPATGQTDTQVQDQAGTQTGDQTQQGTQEQVDPSATQPEEPTQPQPAPVKPKTHKSFTWYSHSLKFTTFNVLEKTSLNANSEPLDLKVKIRKKNRKLTWKAPRNAGSVDGFIVLKRTGKKGAYKQYAVLGPGARSYVDKKAKKKQKIAYTVVGY